MQSNFETSVNEESFDYEGYQIVVTVKVYDGYVRNTIDYGRTGWSKEKGFIRKVSVEAYQTGEQDESVASNCTTARIYEEGQRVWLFPWTYIHAVVSPNKTIADAKSKKRASKNVDTGPSVNLSVQIEDTVRPILDKIEHKNEFADDIEVDVEVNVERVASDVATSGEDFESMLEQFETSQD